MVFVTAPCHFCYHREANVSTAKSNLSEAWQKKDWRAGWAPLRLLLWHFSHAAQPKARLILETKEDALNHVEKEQSVQEDQFKALYNCPWCGSSKICVDVLIQECSKSKKDEEENKPTSDF